MSKKSIDDLVSFFDERLSDAELKSACCLASIASAITDARVSNNMSQSELAERIGVTQGMISKWENGDYNFTIEKLYEIAEKLDLDVNISISEKSNIISRHTTEGKVTYLYSSSSANSWKAETSDLKEM